MKLDYVSRISFGLQRYKTIYTKKATSRVLDGSYNSIYKGRSMNFDELREYVPGDDIKDIDWKATSRSQKVLVRQYIAEKKHNIMFVMDTNRRMLADTDKGEEKRDVALIAGGSLAYMVDHNGDYVSAIFPDSKSMRMFPFKRGLLNLENILSNYHDSVTTENCSDLNGALSYLMRNIRRRMIIVIITDLEGVKKLSDSVIRQLLIVHDVLLINVSDADMFGKKIYSVERNDYLPPFVTENKRLKAISMKKRHELKEFCEEKLNHHGIAHVTVDETDHIDRNLIELLEKHKLWK
ncbi:MAG: DUF58 domain-containing protein [Clostridiales bacterium]|nr:DUF58 domain-containing protein [Clostridiales bacterium]